jgi:hypothetical protein
MNHLYPYEFRVSVYNGYGAAISWCHNNLGPKHASPLWEYYGDGQFAFSDEKVYTMFVLKFS